MTVYMIIELIHLMMEVKCNSYIIMYSKFSTRNYSTAGKRAHAIGLLPKTYLTYRKINHRY